MKNGLDSTNIVDKAEKQTDDIISRLFQEVVYGVDKNIMQHHFDSFMQGKTIHIPFREAQNQQECILSPGYIGTQLRDKLKKYYNAQGVLFHVFRSEKGIELVVTKNKQQSTVKKLVKNILGKVI